ncbi:MAG: hypothetical protein OEW45_02445 [Deltaproteobacteria bacterium]|nr:hypothetical protein [Deltaproteobacteria bacterium]
MRALFVLTPAESKRLIGRAVAELEEVKRAKANGKILIGHGSTNVLVAEEILGKEKVSKLWPRETYLSGVIQRGTLCTLAGTEKPPILLLNRGRVEPPADTMEAMLRDFGRDSIFIKGANCVDPEGNAGVFMAHPEGGTIGWAIGTILARGIRLIVPVGLEKLVPSVFEAVALCGQQTFDYCQGLRVGLIPLSGARVVTEIKALKILAGADAFHVASGGCSGSEGAVTLVVEGGNEVVQKAVQCVESVKGEPPIMPGKGSCTTCILRSPAQPKDYKYEDHVSEAERRLLRCRYQGKPEEEIPPYLRTR